MDGNQLLTVREIADRYRVKVRTVRYWITSGVGGVRLKAEQIGQQYRIEPESLKRFIQQCQTPVVVTEDTPTPAAQSRRDRQVQQELINRGL